MIRLYVIGGLVLLVLITAGVVARHIYNAGQDAIRVEQERKFQDLEERSNRVKDDALRAPDADVDERLRRDSRPDP